jgi:Large ribosomal RNA subunit accumulation protein YceD
MSPELHRPVATDRIGPDGIEITVDATAAECVALAARMQVPAVLSLSCRFRLTRSPAAPGIEAWGRLRARVVQTCVVSLEDFEATVAEDFTARFVPAGQESEEIDPEAEDEIAFEHGVIDLGEAAAEQLGLALDPYPRRDGAALPEQEAEEPVHPFAALATRRQPN